MLHWEGTLIASMGDLMSMLEGQNCVGINRAPGGFQALR